MTRNRAVHLVLGLVALIGAIGCGNGGGDDDDDSPCEAAGGAICDAACDCRDGDACAIGDAAGTGTINFDTSGDCRGFYLTLGCMGGGDPEIDYDACAAAVGAAAVDGAQCVGEGAEGAVVLPAECESQE